MTDLAYQLSKPYSFRDLECSLDLKIRQHKQLLEEIKRQNQTMASMRYEIKKFKEELLTQKVLRLIPTDTETEGIMTAEESMKDYFKSKHTTFEEDGYIIGFKHEENRSIIVFMWQDDKLSTKRKMYKKIMKYCLDLKKPIYYCCENAIFSHNSVKVSDNFYKLML